MISITNKCKEPICFYSSWERRLLACILGALLKYLTQSRRVAEETFWITGGSPVFTIDRLHRFLISFLPRRA